MWHSPALYQGKIILMICRSKKLNSQAKQKLIKYQFLDYFQVLDDLRSHINQKRNYSPFRL